MAVDCFGFSRMLTKEQESEFVPFEDGFIYYWPRPYCGAFSAHNLREIADELDKRNHKWDEQVNKYFESEKQKPDCFESGV